MRRLLSAAFFLGSLIVTSCASPSVGRVAASASPPPPVERVAASASPPASPEVRSAPRSTSLAAQLSQDAVWRTRVAPDGSFRVDTPYPLHEIVYRMHDGTRIHHFRSAPDAPALYDVTWVALGSGLRYADHARLLDGAVRGLRRSSRARASVIHIPGLPRVAARQVTDETSGGVRSSNTFVIHGERLYQLIVTGPQVSGEDIWRFVDSFHPTRVVDPSASPLTR